MATVASHAQTLATYTVVGPQYAYYGGPETNAPFVNDAHNTLDPNDVTPTQSVANTVLAPAGHLVQGPDLNPGYPFGYTIAANQAYYPTSLAGAESAGTYLTFTISPQIGNILYLTNIDLSGASFSSDFAGLNAQSTGMPASGYVVSLTSSVDGFTTSLGSTSFNYSTNGTDITLGTEFLQPIYSTATFHLDFYGTVPNEPAYAYLTLNDGSVLKIDGTSVLAPEPGTYALLGLGLALLAVTIRSRRQFNA